MLAYLVDVHFLELFLVQLLLTVVVVIDPPVYYVRHLLREIRGPLFTQLHHAFYSVLSVRKGERAHPRSQTVPFKIVNICNICNINKYYKQSNKNLTVMESNRGHIRKKTILK